MESAKLWPRRESFKKKKEREKEEAQYKDERESGAATYLQPASWTLLIGPGAT